MKVLFNIFLLMMLAIPATFAFAQTGDAIGVRVLKNPDRLSPATWYFRNVPNPGQPQSTTVNGYPAIKDGRTTYVAATNVGTQLFSNIYVISYSEAADTQTVEVFNALLDSWLFNTNVSNLDDKIALRNDMKRAGDLNDIKIILDRYRDANGQYPSLQAGTYVQGTSFSAWPSWQATLGNTLGTALPRDPVNTFNGCSGEFDGQTCWNENTSQFQCPFGSKVYAFTSSADGNTADVFANFEYENGPVTWKTGQYEALLNQACFSTTQDLANVDNDGDGIVNSQDNCDDRANASQGDRDGDGIGDACDYCPDDTQNDEDKDGFCFNVDNCPLVSNPDQADKDSDGRGDVCDLITCGNGLKEGLEQCDGTDGVGLHQACTSSCVLQNLTYCGDGVVQPLNEEGGIEECDTNPGSGLTVSDQYQCNAQCKWTGGYCGDGQKNGPEACDGTSGASPNGVCKNDCSGVNCNEGYADGGDGQCLPDQDNDGLPDAQDNCLNIANPDQANMDNDQYGDVCDFCPDDPGNDGDGDGICAGELFNPEFRQGGSDNCPALINPDQADLDQDGQGDVCDAQTCGNFKTEEGEVCDGPGQGTGPDNLYQCSADCQSAFGGYCGDNITNGNEQCDGTDAGPLNYYACNADCTAVGGSQGGYCGDDIIQPQFGEECDGTSGGYDPVSQACSSACKIEAVTAYCGNGVVDAGEQCDNGNQNGTACNPNGGYCQYCKQDCTTASAGIVSGEAGHGQVINVPSGTVNDWVIFATLKSYGQLEWGSMADNGLIQIDTWADPINNTQWQVHAQYLFSFGCGGCYQYYNGVARYVILPAERVRTGIVNHGQQVTVPYGTVNDWNILVTPRYYGWREPTPWEADNGFQYFEMRHTVSTSTSWTVTGHHYVTEGCGGCVWYQPSSGRPVDNALMTYLIVPKAFSQYAVVGHGNVLTAPSGTTNNWALVVTPFTMGQTGGEANTMQAVESYGDPINGTQWQINSRYFYDQSNWNFQWWGHESDYLLISESINQ